METRLPKEKNNLLIVVACLFQCLNKLIQTNCIKNGILIASGTSGS